jgi:hypothetical protein
LQFLCAHLQAFGPTAVPLWENSTTMLKLLFWGLIGYVIYRYFQMKEQLKEGRYRDFVQHRGQSHEGQQPSNRDATTDKQKDGGEFIDYEEVK